MDHTLKRHHVTDQDAFANQNSKPAGVHLSQSEIYPSSTCDCVRQIIEQLVRFKALSVSPQRFQPDFVLTLARDSLVGWRPYLECSSYQCSGDKDVLVLSVMALRALVNLIQEVGLQRDYQSRHDDTDEEVSTDSSSSAPFLDSQNSFLGTYPLACEEKRLVVDLLLNRTLKSLNCTVKNLREKSLTVAGTSSKSQSASSQSYRSRSSSSLLSASPPFSYGFSDELVMSGRTGGLDSPGFSLSLDEHDNYLQKSLQNLTSNIESLLMIIQTPQASYKFQ